MEKAINKTRTISGYKFTTIEKANTAIDLLNTTFGIPVNEDNVTRTFALPEADLISLGNADFYYFEYEPKMEAVLGKPKEIIVQDKTNKDEL